VLRDVGERSALVRLLFTAAAGGLDGEPSNDAVDKTTGSESEPGQQVHRLAIRKLDAPSLQPVSQHHHLFGRATAPCCIVCTGARHSTGHSKVIDSKDLRHSQSGSATNRRRPALSRFPHHSHPEMGDRATDSPFITTGRPSPHRGCEPGSRCPWSDSCAEQLSRMQPPPVGAAGANLGIAAPDRHSCARPRSTSATYEFAAN
jgi:hypothetical protein